MATATVTPISKAGKNNSNHAIYRLIFLACLWNTSESIVNNRLVWYLKANTLMTDFQCDFQKTNNSTPTTTSVGKLYKGSIYKKSAGNYWIFLIDKVYASTWKFRILRLKFRIQEFFKNFIFDIYILGQVWIYHFRTKKIKKKDYHTGVYCQSICSALKVTDPNKKYAHHRKTNVALHTYYIHKREINNGFCKR